MCTDGIIEATQYGNASEIEYGEERLISILNAHAKSNVSVIKEKIISDIAMFSNNKLADDFSIILIKKMNLLKHKLTSTEPLIFLFNLNEISLDKKPLTYLIKKN